MKNSILLPPLFLLFLLSPTHASEASPIPLLAEKFNQSGSAADGAMVFKNCAALSNTLLNAYEDSIHGEDDSLLSVIDEWSLKTDKYVEIASNFASSVEKEEAEKATATAELGIISGIRFDNMVSIFDENYYDLLRFYTEALQNTSLRVVKIENNISAFVVDIGYSVRRCDELLAAYGNHPLLN